MKVVVTGASGQLGRALVKAAPMEAEIISATHAQLDISDSPAISSFLGRHAPDVILNAAAYTQVDRAEHDVETARRANTDGPRNLAMYSSSTGARLVHISTDFVFDGMSSTPYRPSDAPHPLSVYGQTKREGELAVLDAAPEYVTILRTARVYAAVGHNFVHTMLRLMRQNEDVRVIADQVGTPTSADSLANAVWKLVATPEVKGIHHWTDAGVATWYDFATAIAEEAFEAELLSRRVSVEPIATSEYRTPARRPAYSVLDTTSLHPIGIQRVHWRKHLRRVLGEIKSG